MKRIVLFGALTAVLAVGSVSADSDLHVKAFGTVNGGAASYHRGVSGGAQVSTASAVYGSAWKRKPSTTRPI